MRNDSSGHPACCRTLFLAAVLAAAFALLSPRLRAQCTGEDPDSFACQLQQPADTSTQSSESPAVFDLSQPEQKQPRADRSNEASASGSLPGGSTYTEGTLRQNRQGQFGFGAIAPRPEPPTEFQRFVAATTGQMLPIYGAGLFSDRQASFGPIESAPAPADLIVGPEDELRIRIWGQVNFSANLRVSREGEIYLPKAGAIHVAGLAIGSVEQHLRQALDRIYRNYEISVDMGEIHSIQIYVAGEARQPGEYTVSALSTLVDAVFASGGPSAAGSMRHIQLKRGGKILTDFDLYTLLVKGDKSGDMQLQPGDVLYIPAAGPQIALLGSVRQPGIYELRGQEPLATALDAAGGRTAMAEGACIFIDRIAGGVQPAALELTADAEGMGALLADGDIVRVDPIVSDYRDTVTIRGSIANPGRFRWHAGMHLSDLMPDRDSLVTRGYWWHRTRLGLPAPEFSPDSDQASSASPSSGNQPARSGFVSSEESRQADLSSRSAKPAAVLSPAAQTNWDYAVIERLDPDTMKTSLISFDLGKLVLERDSSQDRELKAGDVVTIFSEDDVHPPIDRLTKYVTLDGEVVRAGVYSVAPGETLRSVVMRAGGLTSKAYLYGAEFTRKSTQALEQQRLNEYADRLEHLMERSSLTLSQTQSEGPSQAPGQTPALSVNRDPAARLRQMRARGRIVLGLLPESNSAAGLPEIPLEDGDELVVPFTPSTIQVIGAVFNQNAFLYRRGARVSGYLRFAGGPTREADREQAFVLRADGSVLSRSARQSLFAASDFDNVRLYPGDTIVVPEKMVKPSALRELALWTQLMSPVSLSAAAIDVIK
jgi:protein involved in polysaccharide export with SLBB domain